MAELTLEKDSASVETSVLLEQVQALEAAAKLQQTQCESLQQSQAQLEERVAQEAAARGQAESEKASVENLLSEREAALQELETRLEQERISREELEESLLDTQELVACMEHKLEESHKLHR